MRRPLRLALLPALGLLTAVAVAWTCAVVVPVNGLSRTNGARVRSAAGFEGEGYITVARWDKPGSIFLDVYVAPAEQQPMADEWGERQPDSLVPSYLRRAALPWVTGDVPW